MQFLKSILAASLILCASTCVAQGLEFDKKSGDFRADTQSVAKLGDMKVKGAPAKNYWITGTKGDTLITYNVRKLTDTLGGPEMWYYEASIPAASVTLTRGLFLDMFNTFRNVGEEVTKNNLLNKDGSVNTDAAKAYQAKFAASIPQQHLRSQDSIYSLINIPTRIPQRDARRPIEIDQYGRIGQDNQVIGHWEEYTLKEPVSRLLFVFKNTDGGIVACSWADLSTFPHGYLFNNGVRTDNKDRVFSYQPGSNTIAYVQQVSTYLVSKGIL